MRLAALALALHDPADERHGEWSRKELEAMNARFIAALEQAFELALHHRKRSHYAQAPVPSI